MGCGSFVNIRIVEIGWAKTRSLAARRPTMAYVFPLQLRPFQRRFGALLSDNPPHCWSGR